MSETKTPGQVAYEAAEARVAHLTNRVASWERQGETTRGDFEDGETLEAFRARATAKLGAPQLPARIEVSL